MLNYQSKLFSIFTFSQVVLLLTYAQQVPQNQPAVDIDSYKPIASENASDVVHGTNEALVKAGSQALTIRSGVTLRLKANGRYRFSCEGNVARTAGFVLQPGVSLDGNGATLEFAGQRGCVGMFGATDHTGPSFGNNHVQHIAILDKSVGAGATKFVVDNIPPDCQKGAIALQKFVTIPDDKQESRYWGFSHVSSCDAATKTITTDAAAPVTVSLDTSETLSGAKALQVKRGFGLQAGDVVAGWPVTGVAAVKTVSNTPDGPNLYKLGVDYQIDKNRIVWLASGHRPPDNTTYYVSGSFNTEPMCTNYDTHENTCSLWIFASNSLQNGLLRDFYVHNLTVEGANDPTRTPSGLYLQVAKNVDLKNLTYREVYSGVYAQYIDGLTSTNLIIDGALAPTANNKAIDLAECVRCVFRDTKVSRFAGYGIYAEAYTSAQFSGLTISDTSVPGKDCRYSKPIVVHTGSTLSLADVDARGDSNCNFAEILADPNEHNSLEIHNLTIENPNINLEAGVFARTTGTINVKAGAGFTGVFTNFISKTLTIKLAVNRKNQTLILPDGLYRNVTLKASTVVGLGKIYFQNPTGAGFTAAATLNTTQEKSCLDRELEMVCGFGPGGGNPNKFNSLGLTGKKISVDTDATYPPGGDLVVTILYAMPDNSAK